MRRILSVLWVAVALWCGSGCRQRGEETAKTSAPAADGAAEAEKIGALSDEFGAAATASDVDRFLGLFTDDAILMPPNGQMIAGKEMIRPWIQTVFEARRDTGFEEVTTPKEIRIFDGWAYDLGIAAFKSGGKPIENSNKFIRIWQKQADGSWKLARIMWNPNNPPQSPPEGATRGVRP
jgi:uncharacterized protein (TIGR02246 family)